MRKVIYAHQATPGQVYMNKTGALRLMIIGPRPFYGQPGMEVEMVLPYGGGPHRFTISNEYLLTETDQTIQEGYYVKRKKIKKGIEKKNVALRSTSGLAKLRVMKNLTQQELADKMAMSRGAIWALENASKKHRITDIQLQNFADVFGITQDEFIGHTEFQVRANKEAVAV